VHEVSATAFTTSVSATVIVVDDSAVMRRFFALLATSDSPVARITSPTRNPMVMGLPLARTMVLAPVVSEVKSACVLLRAEESQVERMIASMMGSCEPSDISA
jgi:hypothetical protein